MSVYYASSCELSDVNQKFTLCSAGDIIYLPTGSATWTSSFISGIGIQIIGPGSSSCTITNNAPSGVLFYFNGTGTDVTRVSGMTISSSDSAVYVVQAVGPIFNLRVDRCFFEKGNAAIMTNNTGDSATGKCYGVVDRCIFHNMERPYYCQDHRSTDSEIGSVSWIEGITPGSRQMMYFEDNSFVWDDDITIISQQGAVYGERGGAMVFRNNICNGMSIYVDAHGDALPSVYSTKYYEIYNNIFNEDVSRESEGKMMYMRGGSWLVYNNIFNSTVGIPMEMTVYRESDIHRVSNTFFYNNTWITSSNQSSMVRVADSGLTSPGYSVANIIQDTNYFLRPVQSGDVYHPYTPLIYPHPLVTELDVNMPNNSVVTAFAIYERPLKIGTVSAMLR